LGAVQSDSEQRSQRFVFFPASFSRAPFRNLEVKLTVSLHRRLIAAALRNGGLSDPPSFDGYLD
jgi:hypothetical protein